MPIINPTVEHYKDFSTRYDKGFRDYFFQACLSGDDGKGYFMVFSLSRMENRDEAGLHISSEPFWFMTTPANRIIQRGEKPEFSIRSNQRLGALKTDITDSAVTLSMEGWEMVCTPPTYHLKYQGEGVSLDMAAGSMGIPFWFNQGNENAPTTPSTSGLYGYELFANLKGTMSLGGKEIRVQGVAVHEHLVAKHIAWMEFGWQDWIWFVFDELYGLIFDMHGGGYKDGGIYLRNEKEYLIVEDFDIDHPQWAYSPILQHQYPMTVKLRAKTQKGTLFLEGEMLKHQPWRKINKYRRGMTLPASDMQVSWTGRFVTHDGREIQLNNGRGGDEVIAGYNFVQGNM
jgi:hypothetical protein